MRKQVEESTAAESARRATGAAAERDRRGRFSARRKRATVLRLLRGEDLESVSRELGITAARASQWRDQFLAAGQAGLKSRAPDARMRSTSGCTPRSASCSWRTSCSTRRWTTWRPAALWLGGDRRDEWRPVDLARRAYGVTPGLPRVGTGAVQRLRATARDAVARLTAPRAGRCRHGRGAGRPHPPSARSLTVSWRRVPESVGEAAGRKDPHLRRNGCDG